MKDSGYYIKVIIPLAISRPYTYSVPELLRDRVEYGIRVEVQFGKKKHYTALVVEVDTEQPDYPVKEILDVLDKDPILHPIQYPFWQWLSDYYLSPLGDIMNAALPASLKLTSETMLILNQNFDGDTYTLGDDAYLVAEALEIHNELSLDDVRKILNRNSVYPVIQELLDKDFLIVKEELKERYKPKKEDYIRFTETYSSDPEMLHEALDLTSRSEKQTRALLAIIQESKKVEHIAKLPLQKKQEIDHSVWQALVKKGIIEIYSRIKSRLGEDIEAVSTPPPMTDQQVQAFHEIQESWKDHDVVLLHGITGSGKTRVYIEWINQVIDSGKQVLYLLPEIALTTHIIQRLKILFGNKIGIYHSGLNNSERVEMWRSVKNGLPIVLGARSALFLPFNQLGGIIIDEEHDPSFKQTDPSPRYNTRDSAIYLASLWKIKVLLGSATPSVESYHNAMHDKYGLVKMDKRYGDLHPPEVMLIDLADERRRKRIKGHFSQALIDSISQCLKDDKQALIFRNRRGYAPTLQCNLCGWHATCVHCDVSMTYHRYQNHLRCHYCGYRIPVPVECPACGNKKLDFKGFGTEQIEEELQDLFPDARIGRMDYDTVRSRNAYEKLFDDFESGRIQILVGTQMLSKGLDFENVRLVGVLNAEQSLYFPDFRATERTFQLLTQVSGRAGRKHARGQVFIQTNYRHHHIFEMVENNDYEGFYESEVAERKTFHYPPFFRLIKISLKHKKAETVYQAAMVLKNLLLPTAGKRILGPAAPTIARVRNQYIQDIIIKLERRTSVIQQIKSAITDATTQVNNMSGMTTVRINIDVDPNG